MFVAPSAALDGRSAAAMSSSDAVRLRCSLTRPSHTYPVTVRPQATSASSATVSKAMRGQRERRAGGAGDHGGVGLAMPPAYGTNRPCQGDSGELEGGPGTTREVSGRAG